MFSSNVFQMKRVLWWNFHGVLKLAFSFSGTSIRDKSAAFTVTSRSSLFSLPKSKDEGDGELHPGSREVHVADLLDVAECEGKSLSTRVCFINFCCFLGGTGTQMGRGHFLGDANLFPIDSEGRVDMSPSTKCPEHILASFGRSFFWTCNVWHHCCCLSKLAGNRCMCTAGSRALQCL